MEMILLAVLFAALLGFVALGVEDKRYHQRVEAAPVRVTVAVQVQRWDDGLPKRRSLPWSESAAA